MPRESSAVSDLLLRLAQKPVERYSGEDLLFAMPAPAPAAVGKRPRATRAPVDSTHALTSRLSKLDLRKPLLAAAMLAGGLAIAFSLYKVASGPSGKTIASSAAVAATPTAKSIAKIEAKIEAKPIEAAPALAPAPAPKIEAQPIAAAPVKATVELASVSLESQPAGATVMLVDRGASSLAGTTPLSLSVDPSRDYDLVFTAPGHPAKIAHVDPRTTHHLIVELTAAEAPTVAAATAPAAPSAGAGPAARKHHATRAPTVAVAAASPAKGTGTLMISTKPPCEITIDGKATGLTTPQVSIPLGAGRHVITLSSSQQHVHGTVAVAVTPNHTTRVIRDLMKK